MPGLADGGVLILITGQLLVRVQWPMAHMPPYDGAAGTRAIRQYPFLCAIQSCAWLTG